MFCKKCTKHIKLQKSTKYHKDENGALALLQLFHDKLLHLVGGYSKEKFLLKLQLCSSKSEQ